MGILRDLWNDPDPLKWVVFGGAGVSLAFAGALFWQNGRLSTLKDDIARLDRVQAKSDMPAPVGSMQALADKAEQVKAYYKQIEEDPFAQNLNNPAEDPEEYVSTYVYKQAGPGGANLPNPKISTNIKGGTGYTDTEITVTFPRETIVQRDNIKAFLYNMERSPQVVCTQLSMTPAIQNHKPGMTLPGPEANGKPSPEETWVIESRFTIRRPKSKPGATPGK